MKKEASNVRKTLLILILISTAVRSVMAFLLELSVDEVYYWLYALYPDWSHFDHPPMVGVTIQIFTMNLFLDSELFLRLGPIVFSVLNTLILYEIGKYLRDELTGLYTAFLYTSSIYLSVLSGTFIIPDAPQMLFWITSLYFLLKSLPADPITNKERLNLALAGICIGLAILSKYHGIFIGFGMVLFVVFQNRRWLKEPTFYISGAVALLFTIPILYWNMEHDFVSFGFHSNRVNPQFRLRFDYFFTEVMGQFGYNNPVNYVLVVMAMVAIWRKRLVQVDKKILLLLLFNGLPLWLVFTSFSLFRSTLPHWTGPAFTPFIIIAALHLREKNITNSFKIPRSLKAANYLIFSLAFIAIFVINYLPVNFGKTDSEIKFGDGDFTQDMNGWRQVSEGFMEIWNSDTKTGIMPSDAPILTFRYFPAAHFDYYFANESDIKVYVSGNLARAHNYFWINRLRGSIKPGQDAYTIVVSNWYSDPIEDYGRYFDLIEPPEIIEIRKGGQAHEVRLCVSVTKLPRKSSRTRI